MFCLSCLQESQVVETIEEVWSLLLLKEDQVRKHLNNLDIHKYIEVEKMHP